jgi:hypothetical protein
VTLGKIRRFSTLTAGMVTLLVVGPNCHTRLHRATNSRNDT